MCSTCTVRGRALLARRSRWVSTRPRLDGEDGDVKGVWPHTRDPDAYLPSSRLHRRPACSRITSRVGSIRALESARAEPRVSLGRTLGSGGTASARSAAANGTLRHRHEPEARAIAHRGSTMCDRGSVLGYLRVSRPLEVATRCRHSFPQREESASSPRVARGVTARSCRAPDLRKGAPRGIRVRRTASGRRWAELLVCPPSRGAEAGQPGRHQSRRCTRALLRPTYPAGFFFFLEERADDVPHARGRRR